MAALFILVAALVFLLKVRPATSASAGTAGAVNHQNS
jgi:DHA1 family tetracycline resistance protein-like MFS transporter